MHGGPISRLQPFSAVPERLLIAPQDLRTADATNAADIYGGRFLFSGHLVETQGRSPFELQAVHEDWQRELHSFGWLRDLRAADSQIARQNARALVEDWIRYCGRWHQYGWEAPVVTRRILSWLAHSPFILQDGEHDFYRAFIKSLARQVHYLRQTINETEDGVERLHAALAIASACISMAGQGRFARQSIRRLDQELARQILPDGGHISRNPRALIDILADLLPVRQAFVAQGLEVPAAMVQSVDRMMPMMKFFRHGDGALGHFNGMGSTPSDLVATILAYDDARGAPPSNAPHSGYQRLSGGSSVVLMDAGPAPEISLSGDAHAGCLSFEFSSGVNRIIVNCGVSPKSNPVWRKVSRSTAAHSTASIDDTSSCRFLSEKPFGHLLGAPILSGPRNVELAREDDAAGSRLIASHDGYAADFNTMHERDLRLSADGTVLDGIDTFQATGSVDPDTLYTIRFHLHPALKASLIRAGSALLLVCRDGEAWEFEAPGIEIALEESIYLSDVFGHRKSEQIVLSGPLESAPSVGWQFRRTATAKLSRRGTNDFDETEELPLEEPASEVAEPAEGTDVETGETPDDTSANQTKDEEGRQDPI
ncbi:heparinase II/III family protein [Labrenzia sp. PHM005]|uniref:heparinase II/III family protein n=1 Tax=Labrenzia sp. PHM005 TaxID=2590016 RepID=UPI001FFD0E64|nr:heparinase II/III family protein [Labrenzia sp. PHM005]